jgi:hypothetical protein
MDNVKLIMSKTVNHMKLEKIITNGIPVERQYIHNIEDDYEMNIETGDEWETERFMRLMNAGLEQNVQYSII